MIGIIYSLPPLQSIQSQSHLTTLTNPDILHRPLTRAPSTRPRGPHILNHAHDLHPLRDLPKDNMLPIEKRRRRTGDEKLTTVGIRAGIRHRQQPRGGVLVHK